MKDKIGCILGHLFSFFDRWVLRCPSMVLDNEDVKRIE